MTDQQIMSLTAGAKVAEVINGVTKVYVVSEVRETGTCINERSGAFGHAYAAIATKSPTGNAMYSFSIHSDEYSKGSGYPTHDAQGQRIRGEELLEA